jgi:1,4-dihydroxy-2-naphthoate octaprenyltransferase
MLALAAAQGLLLQFSWGTGDLTIPLGGMGILLGYFVFAPPLSWCRRGAGEMAASLAFGLLPLAAGYYVQCGHAITEILLLGLPLSFAAFNLFLIGGVPSPPASGYAALGLASRLSPPAVGLLFTVVNILTIAGLTVVLLFPASPTPARFGLFLLLGLAILNQELIKRRAYAREERLRLLVRLLVLQQAGLGITFAWGLWGRL